MQKAQKKTGDEGELLQRAAISAQNFEAKRLNAGKTFAHTCMNSRGKEERGARCKEGKT
jgi:hypothetical protein